MLCTINGKKQPLYRAKDEMVLVASPSDYHHWAIGCVSGRGDLADQETKSKICRYFMFSRNKKSDEILPSRIDWL